MTQFGTDLLNSVQKSFAGYLMRDKDLKRIANRVRDGTDYQDANEYAVRVGELLVKSIDDNTQSLAYMSEEVARELLTPLLAETHDLVAGASAQVQKNMNNAAGIGLEALIPDLDTNRIDGLVNKVASYDTYDEARWVMHEPVVNYHQAIVDQAIRKNASAHTKAGFDAVIIRKTEAKKTVTGRKIIRGRAYPYKYTVPCKWCAGLEGVYKYKDVSNTGNDVFRRHEACRCTIIFKDGNRVIDVRTQHEWTGEDADSIAARIGRAEQAQEEKANAEQNAHKFEREFEPAADYAGAKKYASEVLGVEYNMLEKANINVLNAMNKETARIYDKFGNLHDNGVLHWFVNYKKRANFYAAYNPAVSAMLVKGSNINRASSLVKMAEMAAGQKKLGFWSSSDAMHSVRHELGHAVQRLYYDRGSREVQQAIESMRLQVLKDCGITRWSKNDTEEHMLAAGKYLSYYGLMDDGEFIAESVGSYMSDNPMPLAVKVVETLLSQGVK